MNDDITPLDRLEPRKFSRGNLLASASAAAAAVPLLGAAPKGTGLLAPPAGTEQVLTTADSEGLIDVYLKDGHILGTSSLDYPNNEASAMGLAWPGRQYASDRILYPMIRADWKPGGGGDRTTRGAPRYRRAGWKEALDIVASELQRVKTAYGNEAILGGVVGGWQTAGALHTKLGQIGRFLGQYGGFTYLIGSKSYACWQWGAPYSWGVQYPNDSMADTLANTNLLIFWASDPMDNFKIRAVTYGRIRDWLGKLKERGCKMITIDPFFTETAEMSDEWVPIRPSTDTALMAAMAYYMISENKYSKEFIDKYTVGFEPFRKYIMGETDGVKKTAEWASKLTDLPVERILALSKLYAETPRVKITSARGIQRNDHGEQQVRMLITLACLKGEFGLPGGGLTFEIPGFAGVGDAKLKGRGPAGFPGGPNPVTQAMLEQQIAYSMENAPVVVNHNGKKYPYPQPGKSTCKLAYWVGGANLNQQDDINRSLRAYEKFETIICQDSWWTPGTRMADIVLPAATLFERNDITQFWRYVVFQHQICESVGEARTDFEIFKELSKRLGFYDKFTMGVETEDGWLRKLYAASDIPLSYDEFKKAGYYKMAIDETPYVGFSEFRKDPAANPLSTDSGKFEIYSQKIASYNYKECPPTPQWMEPFEWLGSPKTATYPLHLVNKHPKWRRHSSYDNVASLQHFSKVNGYEPLYINPEDARSRGIATGDVVRVFNDRGAVICAAVITERIRPRVLILHEGAWYRAAEPGTIGSVDRGGCVNTLTDQRGTSELAQGPVCHESLVQVEKYSGNAKPNDWAPIVPM